MSTFNQTYLSSFISTLLSEYECVVIPGFGGFITHYKSAQFEEVKNLIHPPSSRVSFNTLLKENDGLLIHELAKDLKVNYKEAFLLVSEIVTEWQVLINKGGRLHLKGLGLFVEGKEGKLNFSEEVTHNLLSDSYGLTSIKAQLIAKDGVSGRLKEEYISRKSSPVFNQKVRKGIAYTLSTAAAVMMITWTFFNLQLLGTQTQSLSLFFHQNFKSDKELEHVFAKNEGAKVLKTDESNSDVIEDTDSLLQESLGFIDATAVNEVPLGIKDQSNNSIDLSEIDNTEVVLSDKESKTDSGKTVKGKYIVVAGCFSSLANAENFVEELKDLGYESHLSGRSDNGLFRVAYGSYNQRIEALKTLASIRLNHNAQAWMTRR